MDLPGLKSALRFSFMPMAFPPLPRNSRGGNNSNIFQISNLSDLKEGGVNGRALQDTAITAGREMEF